MKTSHKLVFADSSKMDSCENESINLVVTSPPYPMIEMWDDHFSGINPQIEEALSEEKGKTAFNIMHQELNKVWTEVDRVLTEGGYACINIGDATRKIGDSFQLYPNHVKILECFHTLGYDVLPCIIWRKQSNKPNKFMGSGMLPPNAYVTLEHEYILIFRKGSKREFSPSDLERRWRSAYFWEERNTWFSDVWMDLKGVSQKLNHDKLRKISAAFPFELAYRLINMYSIQEDFVLDPFLGTGTTTLAAICSGRNSVGYELNNNFKEIIEERISGLKKIQVELSKERIINHNKFVAKKFANQPPKYNSKNYGFPVVANQEVKISLPIIQEIEEISSNNEYVVKYYDEGVLEPIETKIIKNSLSDFIQIEDSHL